jgi:hypothetical protein
MPSVNNPMSAETVFVGDFWSVRRIMALVPLPEEADTAILKLD